MSLSEKQMNHPRFMAFSDTANEVLVKALRSHGFDPKVLQSMDVHAGRVVDEITALLIRIDRAEA